MFMTILNIFTISVYNNLKQVYDNLKHVYDNLQQVYDNLKMFRAIQACLRLSKHFYENFK